LIELIELRWRKSGTAKAVLIFTLPFSSHLHLSLRAAALQHTEVLDFLNHAYVALGTSLYSDQAWYVIKKIRRGLHVFEFGQP
jgi:hypothetical protein